MKTLQYILLINLLSLSCSPATYKLANKTYKSQVKQLAATLRQKPADITGTKAAADWVGTTNFNMRKPNMVIIHHTAQNSCTETLNTFTIERTQVSAHYLICKDGTVQHLLNDYLRGWHAGIGKWGNVTDLNSVSIGIELDNNGNEPFTDEQINNLMIVLAELKKTYNIPTANFIGHADIAPGRKIDPSRLFPWQQLADAGFGYWYDTVQVKTPPAFDAVQALRIIGYDTKDSVAAVKAFKLHFVPQDSLSTLTDADRKIIYNLYRKY